MWITLIINFVNIKPLSAGTAKLRWLTQDIQSNFSSNNFWKPSEQKTLIEWISTFNYNPDTKSYVWQKVNIEWFVILDKVLPKNYFYIWKTLIRCCLADAVTWVLPFKHDDNFIPIEDEWVRISWEMIESEIDNQIKSTIKALNIEKIETPNKPYES